MAEASCQQMLDSVKSFFTSGIYSDFVITCGTDSYNVHKVVVCTRADFFARAVKFGGKEALEDKIDLPEDNPAIVKLLIQYLYEAGYAPKLPVKVLTSELSASRPYGFDIVRTVTQDEGRNTDFTYDFPHSCKPKSKICKELCVCPHHVCTVCCNSSCRSFVCSKCTHPCIIGAADQLITHAKMYEIADKYDVAGLKDLAQEKFKYASTMFWNDDAFPAAAHHALSTTMEEDKGLRDVISSTIADHTENLVNKAEVRTLMAEHNGLALDVVLKGVNQHGWGKK